MKEKMPSGGARKGSGRKNKYGEDTIHFTVRIPESKKAAFKKEVDRILKKWQVKKKKK